MNHRKGAIYNLLAIKDELSVEDAVEAIREFETMVRQLYRQV